MIKKFNEFNEGKANNVAKKIKKETHDISNFQDIIENFIKGLNCKIKKIGTDFEIHQDNKYIGQVMFRDNFINVKKDGSKYGTEFKYNELGKIKSEIKNLI